MHLNAKRRFTNRSGSGGVHLCSCSLTKKLFTFTFERGEVHIFICDTQCYKLEMYNLNARRAADDAIASARRCSVHRLRFRQRWTNTSALSILFCCFLSFHCFSAKQTKWKSFDSESNRMKCKVFALLFYGLRNSNRASNAVTKKKCQFASFSKIN